ncbi:MAG: hypothetical protein ABI581_02525 [Sediminibacterium sp.]
MKKILYHLFIVFCFTPILCAILLSIVEKILPEPFNISYSLYPLGVLQYASLIWPNLLMFYSVKFLFVVWIPYLLIQLANQNNRFITHVFLRFMILVILTALSIKVADWYDDFFRSGNSSIKWICFFILISAILSLLPVKWSLPNMNQKSVEEDRNSQQ